MLMSSTLPSSVRSDRMRRQMPSSSSSLQSVASPSVMLNTTGGKLPAFSGRCVHSAARSRTWSRASYIGVSPWASGTIHAGTGSSSSSAVLPSGRRYSPCTVAGAGAMRSISTTERNSGRSPSSGFTPRPA